MKRITVFSTIGTLFAICFFVIIATTDDCNECFSVPVMMMKSIVSGLVIFIGSIYCTWLYLKNEKRIFLIETMPLLETNEAAAGVPFACEGKVVPDETKKLLTSPYTDLPCVYYHCITEQHVREGKSWRWKIIENQLAYVPFYLSDDRGRLKIDPTDLDYDFSGFSINRNDPLVPDPENSEIDCTKTLTRYPFGTTRNLLGYSSYNLRRSEFILPPYVNIFAHGYVYMSDGELVLREHPLYPLIISQKTKDAYVEEFYKGRNLVYLVHLLIAAGYTVALLSLNYFLRLQPMIINTLLVAGNGLFTVSILFTMYNRLVTLSERARFALHDIDIELKRRSELIPQITDVVKAYSEHEQEIQQFVALIRTQILFLKELPSVSKPDMTPLTAIVEKYPNLKASDSFKSLMNSLVDTEERIAYARTFYNRNVRKLNTLIMHFPFIIISKLSNIKAMNYIG